jgi:hypothetical protein
MTDLDKLIEAVDAGSEPVDLWLNLGSQWNIDRAEEAFHGSLDAAHRLHEALLVDRVTGVSLEIYGDTTYVAIFWGENNETVKGLTEGNNPARAWLLAILRALKAKGYRNGTV